MPKKYFSLPIFLLFYWYCSAQNTQITRIQSQNLNDSLFFVQANKIDVKTLKPDTLSSSFLIRLAILKHKFDNDLISAISLTQKAINIRNKSKTQPNIISKYYYNLSYFLIQTGDYERAIPVLKTGFGLELNRDRKAFFLLGLIDAYSKIGDFQNAIYISKLGLSISNNSHLRFDFLNSLIHTYNSLKRYDLALSVKISNQITVEEYHRLNLNRAISFQGLKQYDKARQLYKSLGIFQQTNQDFFGLVSYSYNNIIYNYIQEEKWEEALLYSEKANEVCEKYLNEIKHENIARLYENEGYVYFKKKQYSKALITYQKALLRLPFTYLDKNPFHYPSLKKINTIGNKPYVLSIIEAKAMAFSELFLGTKKDKYAKSATEHYLLADSLIDLMRREHTEQASKLFWREKTHSFYENAIETCYRTQDYQKAFYFMEKSRAILLLDALRNLDAKNILNPQQQAEEQNLRYSTIGLENKLQSLSEQDKNYNTTFQALFVAKENYQRFIKGLEKSNPAYYRLKYDNQYVSLANWQQYLVQNQQTALQYFVGDSAVYALAVSPQKVTFKKINLPKYKHLAVSFNRLAAQTPPYIQQDLANLRQTAHQLYQLVFKPFNLPKGRIVVSPDGYFIPFNALVSDPKTGKYLLQNYAFSYTYSANILIKIDNDKWHFRNNLLAVSPVDFQSNLNVSPLVKSDEYAERISEQYFSGKLLANNAASKASFIENAPNYQLIQLFTHGNADSTEANSKIYFQDKTLNLKELYSLPQLQADLVVLSACQSNLGQIATGEGVMSVARGFSYLGVPSTVSTLWSVDALSTYKITETFYKYLDEGYEKDIALQMAQKEYVENSEEQMPYFWSAMVLVGKADKISANYWVYVLLVSALVVLAIIRHYYSLLTRLK